MKKDWGFEYWKPANDIPALKDSDGDLNIFMDDIEPNDIKMGGLQDAPLLSILSGLAENPDRIIKLFESKEVNE